MKYIITTDTHLGHEKMLKWGRPPDFEKKILKGLESVASHSAILIHLGDICIGNDRANNRLLTSIPFFKKYLIRGNHDRKSNEWYLQNGWDMVCNTMGLGYNGDEIIFSHMPVNLEGGAINIHGHFHDVEAKRIMAKEPHLYAISQKPAHVLLSLERNCYMPFNLDTIVKNLTNKQ